MGARLSDLADADERFEVVARITRSETEAGVIDAVIDVSSDEGARSALGLALEREAAVLLATTGLSGDTLDRAHAAARRIPVMIAPNTSIGVAVMKHLAATAVRLLGETFDLSLVEFHHRAKKDAPSGTAHAIRREIESRTGRKISQENFVGIRAGDIVGEHFLRLCGPSESLEIIHRAHHRDLFARGALEACAWLVHRRPGLYRVEDSLGLTDEARL